MIVFVSAVPDKNGVWPPYLEQIEDQAGLTLVHPNYDMKSPQARILFKEAGKTYQEQEGLIDIINKDIWLIGICDILVYDIDINLGYHYLMAAIMNKKPIIAISEYMNGIGSPYFAPYIREIIKPQDLTSRLHGLTIEQNANRHS